MSARVEAAVAAVVRREWSVVVATCCETRRSRLAEDAVQEAAEAALTSWVDGGVPDRPAAWITTVARRRAIDRLRRERMGRDKAELVGRLEQRVAEGSDPFDADESIVRDDQLRLIFGCCHPALRVEDQMALTLRSIAGLTTTEIARAFLVPEATMAQRLVRAKRKIAGAGIPFVIPPDSELLERLSVVRGVIYLLFNEGYNATEGEEQVRIDLCEEAIRLAGLLATLVSDDAESLGLYSLCLLTHSRHAARTDAVGEIVLLADQDRSLWDQSLIAQGVDTLERAMRLSRLGASSTAGSNRGAALRGAGSQRDRLGPDQRAVRPTQPVESHTGDQAEPGRGGIDAFGPERGLAMMDEPELATALDGYSYYHSARAELLSRSGQRDAAVEAYERALELVEPGPQRRLLERQLAELAPGTLGP